MTISRSPKSKLKSEKKLETSFENLITLLQSKGIDETQAIEIFTLQDSDPAKTFYRTVVTASRELQEKVWDKTLNVNDKYQASLLRLLEVGDKISKTVSAAKMDAYPPTDQGQSPADRPFGDR
jgi:hypothetical protein